MSVDGPRHVSSIAVARTRAPIPERELDRCLSCGAEDNEGWHDTDCVRCWNCNGSGYGLVTQIYDGFYDARPCSWCEGTGQ